MGVTLRDQFARRIHAVFCENLMQNATTAIFEIVGDIVFLDQTTQVLHLVRSGDRRGRRLMIVDHEDFVLVPNTVNAKFFQFRKPVAASRVHFAPDILARRDRVRTRVGRQNFFGYRHTHCVLLSAIH